MYAKSSLVVSIAVLAFGISACGSSSPSASPTQPASTSQTQTTAHTSHSPSAVDLVRQTAIKLGTALTSSHPEDACQYYAENFRDDCISAIAMAKTIHIKPSSFLPVNWRELIAKASVTFHGDTAVMDAEQSNKKNMTFVNVDGTWLRSS